VEGKTLQFRARRGEHAGCTCSDPDPNMCTCSDPDPNMFNTKLTRGDVSMRDLAPLSAALRPSANTPQPAAPRTFSPFTRSSRCPFWACRVASEPLMANLSTEVDWDEGGREAWMVLGGGRATEESMVRGELM